MTEPKENSKKSLSSKSLSKKSLSKKESIEEIRRKERIKDIIRRFPSILQITSIGFKETATYIREPKPTVRCVHTIPIKSLVRTVINEEWKLRSPRIVVLVMSNVGPLHRWTDSKQIKSFQKGLMKAAENTNMWLITNGIDIGITKIIGDAVSDFIAEAKYKRQTDRENTFNNLNFIGIAEEDKLKYLQSIINSESQRVEILDESSSYEKNKFQLNKNLSHYILIKDESIDKNGVNTFLNEFIQFLSFSQRDAPDRTSKSKEDLRSIETNEVPVVSLIIKGGYGCARLVLKQIRNHIPVVVLRGSGGLADLLAFVDIEIRDRSLNVWNPEFVETYLKPELTIKIIEAFPKLRDNSLLREQFRYRILESVRLSRKEGQNYLTIINMFDKYSCDLENLTEYLLLALFRSQRTELEDSVSSHLRGESESKRPTQLIQKDLSLCVDWNCPEMAKTEVLSKDPSFELNSQKILFETSLIHPNRCQFVDLFLSQKFKLRTFVSPKRLKKMFDKLHSREFFSTVCWEAILDRSPKVRQNEKRFLDTDLNWLIESCTGIKGFVDEKELQLLATEEYPNGEKCAERKALAFIVFWALFDFRQKLVRILWRHSDQPISLALIIAITYDRLSKYSADETVTQRLKEESKQFVSFASELLEIIYKERADRAEQILSERNKDWNYYCAIDLAALGKFRAFFSVYSCQKWLTNKMNGNIVLKEMRFGLYPVPKLAKILLSAYLVFPSYFWIQIPSQKTDESSKIKEVEESLSEDEGTDNKPESKEDLEMNKIKLKSNKTIREYDKQLPIHKIMFEVWTAPITKFWNFQFFYSFYLVIFSAAVLYPRCGNIYLDIIVILWTSLLIVDSIRQILLTHKRKTRASIVIHSGQIGFQIFFIWYFSYGRYISDSTPPFTPYDEKVVMGFALIHAYYVLLTVFLPMSPTLGPLLYRLRIMIFVDFFNFIRLTLLVMISFGIVIQAILYPDLSLNLGLFRAAFHRAFFSMFRSFDRDLFVEKECEDKYRWDKQNRNDVWNDNVYCSASTYSEESCRVIGFWPYFFYICYYILLKLIFMTLLYAIFSSSATRLTADTDSIWKFQRYGLVMDFITRGPLPPPLNIFYYLYWILRLLFGLCIKCFPNKPENKTFSFCAKIQRLLSFKTFVTKEQKELAEDDYTYLQILASEIYDKYEERASSESLSTRMFERTKANSEELEYQRRTLRQLKGKMSEMERSIRQTYTILELIKHMTTQRLNIEGSGQKTLHVLSRYTPYPNTSGSIHRYPVPDKYVPWSIMFIDYDPTPYTKSKEEFSPSLQEFVDIDILAIQSEGKKLPVLEYNRLSVSGGGITIDRRSWEETDNEKMIYKLENGIPVNPFGRTGLKGRGSLVRWGPNHYVMVVITRDNGKNDLEVLVEKENRKTNSISLIVRFIPSEIHYKSIESLFKTDNSSHKIWNESKEMIDYFASFVQNPESNEQSGKPLIKDRLKKGYFDDPLNTDQAWKEVELWHFHYFNQTNALNDVITDSLEWRSVTEMFFSALTLSQSNVIQMIADKLKARIH